MLCHFFFERHMLIQVHELPTLRMVAKAPAEDILRGGSASKKCLVVFRQLRHSASSSSSSSLEEVRPPRGFQKLSNWERAQLAWRFLRPCCRVAELTCQTGHQLCCKGYYLENAKCPVKWFQCDMPWPAVAGDVFTHLNHSLSQNIHQWVSSNTRTLVPWILNKGLLNRSSASLGKASTNLCRAEPTSCRCHPLLWLMEMTNSNRKLRCFFGWN